MKNDKVYLRHILECINNIESYTPMEKVVF